MPVSGPSPYLGKKIESWAWGSDYSGYDPPAPPDSEPAPYGPGPVSSLLDPAELKAITKHATPYGAGMRPTTNWADVVDSQTRAQQRRERGTAGQPTATGRPEQPGAEQQGQPSQADQQRQQAEQKTAAAKAKVQQAQRVRQQAEAAHTLTREKVGETETQLQRANDQLRAAKSELDDWEGTGEPPEELQDAVDNAEQQVQQARSAQQAAQQAEQQAMEQLQQATQAEDAANKEVQAAEQETQSAEQQAQQEQAAQEQPAEGPYGTGPAQDEANPEQGIGQAVQAAPEVPSAEPGQPDQQDPIQRAIAQVKAQGGNADNLLDAIAAEAWKQESGRAAPNWLDPNEVKAYDDYRANWKGAFRAGQDVPLAGNLRAAAGGQSAPAQQAPYDPNKPPSSTNQPPVNPNLIGGPDRPPLAGPGAGPQPAPGATPGVGTNPVGPAGSALPGAPGAAQATPATPPSSGPQLDQANQTLAAAQARDAQLQKQLEQATSAADAAQKKMEAAQEQAKKLSNELSSGVGSPEYRQYSLTPALNQAQGAVSDAAQQLAAARARAAQTQQMLATSQASIQSAQNLVRIATAQAPSTAGPAGAVARDASDAAQAGQLLNTMLARATPEQQQRIIADITTGGPAGTEVLRQIATQAWYKQLAAQGQAAPAGGPPKSYLESWMGMFRAGEANAPLIGALKAELAKRGVAQPRGGALDPRDAGVVPPSANGQGPIGSVLQQTTGSTTPAAPAPAQGPTGSVLVPPSPQQAGTAPSVAADNGPWDTGIGGWYADGRGNVFLPDGQGGFKPTEGHYDWGTGNYTAGGSVQRGGRVEPSLKPVTPSSGPVSSVLPVADNPDSSSPGGPMYGPMNDAQPSGYDAYIKAMRELGDTRSDAELAAEFRRNTTTYPSLQGASRTSNTSGQQAYPTGSDAPSGFGSDPRFQNLSNPAPVNPKLENPPPVTSATTYPQQLPTEQRRLWDEWRAAGGSGNWGDFTRHAVAVGAPDMSGAGAPPVVAGRSVAPTKPPFDPSAPAPLLNGIPVTKIDPIVVSGRVAGVTDEQGQQTIANGINGWLRGDPNAQWAQSHIENSARLGWAAQTGGRPEDAPPDYVAKWVSDFKSGETSSPMQEQLNQALRARGLFAPADGKMGWNPALGARIAQENFWGANPARQAAMVEFEKLPMEQRRAIFENAMDQALEAEGIDPARREEWKQSMRQMTMGTKDFPGENGSLNPFMIAGESGGNPGTANRLNSSALGYFQFLAQNHDGSDYGHWRNFSPYPNDRSQMTNPVTQVRQYIRSVNLGSAHGDPWAYIEQKRRTHVWGP